MKIYSVHGQYLYQVEAKNKAEAKDTIEKLISAEHRKGLFLRVEAKEVKENLAPLLQINS